MIRDLWPHLMLWALAGATAPGDRLAQSSPEYQLKAVFLFNFAQFVEWPASAFPEPDTPLAICVLGEDPFGPYLDETVRGETVGNHPLAVRRYRAVDEVTGCHILFVSRQEQGHLREILDRDRKSTRLNSSHIQKSRMPSSA